MSNQRDPYNYDYDAGKRSDRPADTQNYYREQVTGNQNGTTFQSYSRTTRGDADRWSDARGTALDRDYDRDDDYKGEQRLDRYNGNREVAYGGGRSRSRRRGYDSRSQSRDGSRDRRQSASRSRSRSRSRPRIAGHFGKEKKDLAATVIGALAGGFLAHEASGGKRPINTIGGAVLGALAGNAIEHRHLRKQDEREERERDNDRRYYSN